MSWEVPAGGSGSAGFINTGLGWDGANLLVGDFTNGRIVKTTTAGAYVSEIVLASAPASSVQGVAYDSSDGTYWVCHYAATNGTIRHYDSSGTLLDTFSPAVANAGPNGCAYDAANDRILAIWANGVIRGYDCADASMDETITITGASGSNFDGLALDPVSPSTVLWITADGATGSDAAYIQQITRSTGAASGARVIPSSCEGIAYTGGAWYLCCDQEYHLAVPDGNRVWQINPDTYLEVQPGQMLSASGSFDLSLSSANQVVAGVGFAPRFVLFFGFNNSAGASQASTFGVADAHRKQWAQSIRTQDAANPANNERAWSSSHCIYTTTSAGVLSQRAEFGSVTHDGFVLKTTGDGVTARRVHWIAFGGEQVRAKAGYFDLSTSSGTQAVTGVGFEPAAVLFGPSTSSTTEGLATNESRFALGGMTSAAQWAGSTYGVDNVSPTQEYSVGRTDAALVRIGSGTTTMLAAYSSLDSDGFTVNKSTPPGATVRVGYLALGGAMQISAGTLTQPTSTGNAAVTGVGFRPQAILFAGFGKAAGTTPTANATVMVGAALSSSNRRAHQSGALNASAASDTSRDTTETAAIIASSAGGTPTRLATADFVSHDSDGFTVNWTAADAIAREVHWLAFGQGIPTLSNARVTGITATGATPLVDYAY
jgi:hypothetical protein